ncbi:kelch domain-containing protein 4 [Bacillus rossius redtenbacheri]|uniref:kelch domain-containing protein 4 n=1 Tax=Bacillus rossius redtenbacheri TaxID=93214 RepID=UPI002FDD9942
MGKKDKGKKKGKGAEKTTAKTEKKLCVKFKKELAAKGEDDIEKIVAEIEREEQRRNQVVEHIVPPPSRRVNFTFVANKDKEEIIMFGGEYFNGQKMSVYNDLLLYNVPRNEWQLVKAPGAPPPRCGHQACLVPANKGQLWVFGGEYASPTQAQFYHYRDLWVYHLADKKWEKILAAGGPSARSGHRMVHTKKHLIVFGGFHDNLRDYKYFNDVYAFDLTSYTWKLLEPKGTPPSPRSGCIMIARNDGSVLVYGGYSKERIKKDVDKGSVHSDMFILQPDKNDATCTKWKWVSVKHSGVRMSPRCGMSAAVAAGNKAFTFGGVWDVEESEEDLSGTFFNDLHVLDLESATWRSVRLSGKKDPGNLKKRRRKERAGEADGDEGADADTDTDEGGEGEESEKMVTEVSELDECDSKEKMAADTASGTVLADDGVFKVTVGPATASCSSQQAPTTGSPGGQSVFVPSPRMNCGLAVKDGHLYLYGGLVEDGDKQLTLSDLYSLNVHRLDEWNVIIPNDQANQEWLESGSDSDDSCDSESEHSSDEDSDEMDVS